MISCCAVLEHPSFTHRIAEAILDGPLCVHCIAIKVGASPQEIVEAFPTLRSVLTLRINSLDQCRACGSRRAVTYSFSRARLSSDA